MVDIVNAKDNCFALSSVGCSVLSELRPRCSTQCPFYKPVGCEDWIKRKEGDHIWLIPPEEYYAKPADRK